MEPAKEQPVQVEQLYPPVESMGIIANKVSNGYDEIMLNCMRMSSFNKTAAVKLFLQQVKVSPQYAYHVHGRVMKKFHLNDSFSELVNETVCGLRAALQAGLEYGISTGNFDAFHKTVEQSMKITGVQQNVTLVQQNNYSVERYHELRSKYATVIDSGTVGGASGT